MRWQVELLANVVKAFDASAIVHLGAIGDPAAARSELAARATVNLQATVNLL
ncbi:MAG: hypothetical protein ACRDLR_10070 [Gaiellaceae bacterium]